MLATSHKLLHRARSLRRLHNHSQCSDLDDLPAVPVSPVSPVSPVTPTMSAFSSPLTPSMPSMPVAIPMPMPPTQRPRADYDQEQLHYRQVSTCSHVSRASSSWSSNASTTSTTSSSSRNTSLEWDPLRLHPPCMPVRASPQCDAGRSYFHDDGFDSPTPVAAAVPHGFDFGFAAPHASRSRRAAVRQTVADIRLASSEDTFEAQGLSAPPPRHHRLRAHQSEANLQQKMQQLQFEQQQLDRPATPPMPPMPTSEPASPVQPRVQPPASTETERYFKRGDWKRRGIVFGAYET